MPSNEENYKSIIELIQSRSLSRAEVNRMLGIPPNIPSTNQPNQNNDVLPGPSLPPIISVPHNNDQAFLDNYVNHTINDIYDNAKLPLPRSPEQHIIDLEATVNSLNEYIGRMAGSWTTQKEHLNAVIYHLTLENQALKDQLNSYLTPVKFVRAHPDLKLKH